MLLLGMLLETACCLRITRNTRVIDLSFAPITEHQSSMLHYRQSSAAVVVFLQGQSPDLFFFLFCFWLWTVLLLNIKRTLRHSNGQTMPSVWFQHERIKTSVSRMAWLHVVKTMFSQHNLKIRRSYIHFEDVNSSDGNVTQYFTLPAN